MDITNNSCEFLINEIKRVFPIAPLPHFHELVLDPTSMYYETVMIHEAIKNKSWDKITDQFYEEEWGFMCWLTPLGIYYYLPGVMVYTLKLYSLNKTIAPVTIDTELLIEEQANELLDYFNNEQLDLLYVWRDILSLQF